MQNCGARIADGHPFLYRRVAWRKHTQQWDFRTSARRRLATAGRSFPADVAEAAGSHGGDIDSNGSTAR